MAHKHLLFRSEAREKVLRGATAIADAVRVTLGPRSRCVLIEKKWGKPIVCNDGVTIAKEFALKDPDENLGAQMLRGAAERTGDAVGDGTTTSTMLAHAIVADGMRNIAAGASAIDLKRGLDRAARRGDRALRRSRGRCRASAKGSRSPPSRRTTTRPSASSWRDAIEKVGAEGAVTVEEAEGHGNGDGSRRGAAVRPRATSRRTSSPIPKRWKPCSRTRLILLYEGKISAIKDILPLLEQIAKRGLAAAGRSPRTWTARRWRRWS